jgi:hypothetical protein
METGRTLLHGVIIELSAQDAEIILVRQGLSGSLSLTRTKRLDSHVWRSHNKGGQAAKRFGNARGEVISEYIRKACDFVRGMLIPGVRVLIAGPPVVRAECKHCLERSTLPHRVQVATCPAPYDKGRHRTDSYVQLLGSLFPHGLAAEPVLPRQSGLSHAVRRARTSLVMLQSPPLAIDGLEADRDDVVTALNDADPAEDHLAPREEASLHDTPSISAFTEHHPDKSSGEAHTCVYCGRPNTRSCCACWQVTYCDRVCQKGHWPLHRVTCTSKRNR